MFKQRFVVAGLALAAALAAPFGAATAQEGDAVVARIGDQVVTAAELEDAWRRNDAASRLRMLQELYDTRRRALEIVVGERLVERAAAERGLTRDELLAEELPRRTPDVSDAEVDLIYERNRNRFEGRSLEEMRPEIRAILERQRPMQALQAYMNELRALAPDVEMTLEPPRHAIETLAEDPVRGRDDAPIELVEFSDFDCPYCRRATETIDLLMEQFAGQIRFVYKDYPLPSHPDAFKAAEAGNCAHEQGRFWELHDTMFASQGSLGVEELKGYAADLGLDTAAFDACLDSGRHAAAVNRDVRIGMSYGVSSTPTLFLNGRAVLGAAPYETFVEIVREELTAAAR
jgi:protein-disulfide isomerase